MTDEEIYSILSLPDIEIRFLLYCKAMAELGYPIEGDGIPIAKYDRSLIDIPLWAVRLAEHYPDSLAYKIFKSYSCKWIDRNYNEYYAL